MATFHVRRGVDEFVTNYGVSEELKYRFNVTRNIPAMLKAADLARRLSLDRAGDPSNDRLTTVTLLELTNFQGTVDQKETLKTSGLENLEGSNWDEENRLVYQTTFSKRFVSHLEHLGCPEKPVFQSTINPEKIKDKEFRFG